MVKLKFDPNQQFQLDAINAATGLFTGQPKDLSSLTTTFRERQRAEGELDLTLETGAVGNRLVLDDDAILENLKSIQNESGLEISKQLVDGLNFDVEMETGTGKTYVYLRTIFELARQYNFAKYIILVPSVAIKEGVATSIRLMAKHFRDDLGYDPFDVTVYSGKNAEDVQSFATATNTQILIMTIDSVRGNRNRNLIIGQHRNQLGGFRPIDYLNATQPIVIMDEPQNMESELSKSAITDLNPMAVFRYSATHRKRRNLIYQLDPIDAHNLNLVKQIVVAGSEERGADVRPYVNLMDVQRDPFRAKLELDCRNKNGVLSRKVVTVSQHADLARVTGNDAYANNWRINNISVEPAQIELTNYGYLDLGEAIGDNADTINRELIRETIHEHLRRRYQLREQGVKVLSLFFIDKVTHYLGTGHNNLDANGQFVEWFDQLYREERNKYPKWKEAFHEAPEDLRKGYFSEMRRGKQAEFVDTSGTTAKDDDAYRLIMKDKEGLLSLDEPVQFIFSHSALREGWDNPNVFQICVLREMGKETERRQTIGRGLRLPVNADGERVTDPGINQLTVVANESYQQFAAKLQNEYRDAGVSIGFLRRGDFAKLPWLNEKQQLGKFGTTRSEQVWEHLKDHGFINDKGEVQANFDPNRLNFTLALPTEYAPLEQDIIRIIDDAKIEKIVKQARKRVPRVFNKQVVASPEFAEFWDRISRRTTYRVTVDRQRIIAAAIERIKHEPEIKPIHVQITRAGIRLVRGGTKTTELGNREADMSGTYDLPDIIGELQEATSLTRKTIVDILIGTDRLNEFIHNPNDFIAVVKRDIKNVLAKIIVDGIQYEQIAGSIYELREMQADGKKENDRFADQLYEVKHKQKTDFDYVAYDSEVERRFAEILDSREDIRLFVKLPPKFLIPTPVGEYNPDWAILKQVDGQDKIYMIRETKSTPVDELLRPTEVAKIHCGKEHFAAIGIEDYQKSTPERWNL